MKKMLCSRCGKRSAVFFITRMEGEKTSQEGLCLVCAKELNIAPISEMLKQFNLDEDAVEEMNDELENMMGAFGQSDDAPAEESDTDGASFAPGGAAFVDFFRRFKPQNLNRDDEGKSTEPKTSEGKKADSAEKGKPRASDGPQHKYLNAYCQNLTEKVRKGKIDHVIGREKEMLRVIQILNRRTKNNPCLIGEPGVGKTAIAEGLAERIVQKKVPANLAEKEVYLLDLTALVAGTQFRGQFESRIKGLLEEIKKVGNVILVIDEVHNLVGTGDAEGSMNAANMLKPALSRGEIQVIGATTLNEYRKYIEKDAALERRFQPVIVNEPSMDETVTMLEGIKGHYEAYHQIKVPSYLVVKAVQLSERYVTDRYLPDKAIDLLDEACSNAVLKNPVYEQYYYTSRDLLQFREQLDEQESLEEKNEDVYKAIADLKATICRLEEQCKTLKNQIEENTISLDDLILVIELWTGVPASKIKEAEGEKLRRLEDVLRTHIVGQEDAIRAVANAVRRSRVALVPRRRPISFIFTGPTGVGKTELVRVLANELFDSPETLIRLDMSEFMEKHAVSRIIGAPPGYVGYDEAGQLTEKIRRKPYSVVLFDEIEKAHPDVLNILLQILDDGRITDAHGRTVSFEHTIIVMTSNAGSNIKNNPAGFNKSDSQISAEKTKQALSEFLRPEFLNRVDEIIAFAPLGKEIFGEIVRIALRELEQGLKERNISFICSEAAIQVLAEQSYSAAYGARNVRRTVQQEIEDRAVNLICDGNLIPSQLSVDAEDGEIKLEIK